MDKASIIRFSDTVREKLFQETQRKAAYYGIFPDTIQDVDDEFEDSIVISGRVFNKKIKQQREQLVREVREKGYEQVMDKITYTWFNRFVALKFMEVNGYLPVKVFSSDEAGKQEPDILTKSLKLDYLNIDRDTVLDLKSGGKDEELYKHLTLSLCNYLNDIMPFLFEPIEDYTELLFPGKLLHTDSILVDLNNIIKEDDWKEVEVIGWIYQDYINPRKDKVFADLKKNIKISKENIPAATQLFTPKWIVKYLVENSVGRLWLESNSNSDLQSKFRYFIEQETRPPENKIFNPEEITVLDPAMGSGHILVYTFEVLYEIYRSQGYLDNEIAPLILNKNLYGLEIDDRAAQLAGFALMMKAMMYDRELFNKKVDLNLCAIQETRDDCTLSREKYPELCRLWDFFVDAKDYGSILKVEGFDFEELAGEVESLKRDGTLDSVLVGMKVEKLVKQAGLMGQKYDCVVTNPPYMGSKGMNAKLQQFVINEYPDSKRDLMTCFMEKGFEFLRDDGYLAMINIPSWMFLSSFANLRNNILTKHTINSLLHNGRGIFGSDFGTVAFVANKNKYDNFNGVYRRLFLKQGGVNSIQQKEAWFLNKEFGLFLSNQDDFLKIPESPIAYWVSKNIYSIFKGNPSLNSIGYPRQGMATSDNDKFLRFWYEPNFKIIGFGFEDSEKAKKSQLKWFPYQKGGSWKKWYGNNEYIVNWKNDGEEIKCFVKSVIRNPNYYFKKGITWSSLTSGVFSARFSNTGNLFDSKGPIFFNDDMEYFFYTLGLLNSKVSFMFLKILAPTLDFNQGSLGKIPFISSHNSVIIARIGHLTQQCIDISKKEWDSRETSWDFTTNEFLHHKTTGKIEDAYNTYCTYWKDQFFKLHANEEELNRIFIDIYDLADELTPDVPLKDITILKTESNIKDGELVFKKETLVKQFISYSVGCMFGRYSPNKEGLILANQGETIDDFREKVPDASFMPDDDNIIPILEDEYFTDDIMSRFREFLKTTFGAESLAENLEFIAGALSKSKKGSASPEKVIRDYFLKSFFKDHVKMYKKRPIYWLFTSGKGRGFNALVYMHRYNRETLAKMRTDYLLELEAKLDARIGMLGDASAVEKGRLGKQIEELMDYDGVLHNKSLEYIDIDLDDGVKVNYAKFEGLVGKI